MRTHICAIVAHPALHQSSVHRALLSELRVLADRSDSYSVESVDLYAEYPDFEIDVPREQARLTRADVILLQHPIYWYSAPALLKEWADLVLEYGFAYGSGKWALRGKAWVHFVSTGGSQETYRGFTRPDGDYTTSLRDLLLPWQKTAELCQCRFLDPWAVADAHRYAPTRGSALGPLLQRFRTALEHLKSYTPTEKWAPNDAWK